MILPNREQAYIPPAKLYDYLLSTSHSIGRSKAKFFHKFGFSKSNASFLEAGLLSIAQGEKVIAVTSSAFGVKYTVDGPLMTPTGVIVTIRTVWIIETGEDRPRFITAYPRQS